MRLVIDPSILAKAFANSHSREAKLLSLAMYGWVCANAGGHPLDEANALDREFSGTVDAIQLDAVRVRAERIQFDAQLRKALVEEALGPHAPDDLVLVTSPALRTDLARLLKDLALPISFDAVNRLIVLVSAEIESSTTRSGHPPREQYLLDIARKAGAVLLTNNAYTDPSNDVRIYSLSRFVQEVLPASFAFDAIDAPAAQRAAVRAFAPIVQALLPEDKVFASLVRDAVANREIVSGARAAAVDTTTLDSHVSVLQAVAGVRQEIAALLTTTDQLAGARGAVPPSGGALQLIALEAERDAAAERLRRALTEQILRQLRAAIERASEDSYSTLLTVADAPGLAQTIDGYGVDTRASDELRALFGRMPAGSIGIAGNRGIGKSHLIDRFCAPIQPDRSEPLLGTVVSAPTQYDSRDFLLHLFGRLCDTIIGRPDVRVERLAYAEHAAAGPFMHRLPDAWATTLAVALAFSGLLLNVGAVLAIAGDAMAIAGAVALLSALLVLPVAARGDASRRWIARPAVGVLFALALLLLAASLLNLWEGALRDIGVIAIALALAIWSLQTGREKATSSLVTPLSLFPEGLVSTAIARLEEINYQKTLATGWSSTANGKLQAGTVALGAAAALTGTRTLSPVAVTFPETVARLRAFLAQAVATELPSGEYLEIRIGIDELDKMESEAAAHRFLNEIKGVFGIPRCFFLVSVSEEALSNFDRRGAHVRDAFDSAFDEIIYVQPLSFAEARGLLAQRVIGLPIPYHGLCHVLSGGLPRDLIRVARAVLAAKPSEGDGSLSDIVRSVLALERDQRLRAVSVAARHFPLEPGASNFLQWAANVQHIEISEPELMSFCSNVALLSGELNEVLPHDAPECLAQRELNHLIVELTTFGYFAATMLAVFDDSLSREALGAATEPRWRTLEALVEARAVSASNPYAGWSLITKFRESRMMTTLTLPQQLRPTA